MDTSLSRLSLVDIKLNAIKVREMYPVETSREWRIWSINIVTKPSEIQGHIIDGMNMEQRIYLMSLVQRQESRDYLEGKL